MCLLKVRIASAGSVNVEVIITIPIVAADDENTAADDTAANDAAADGTPAVSVAALTKAVTQLIKTPPETLSATLSAVQVLETAPAKVETGVVVAIVVAPPPPPSPEGLDLGIILGAGAAGLCCGLVIVLLLILLRRRRARLSQRAIYAAPPKGKGQAEPPPTYVC